MRFARRPRVVEGGRGAIACAARSASARKTWARRIIRRGWARPALRPLPRASVAIGADHRPIAAFTVASLAEALLGAESASAARQPRTATQAAPPRARFEALSVAVVVLALLVAVLAGLVVAVLVVGLLPS